ncbi:MAG: hypothetical protein V1716_04870 [Candidatus Uhrbacteria bacterium]
MKPQYLSESFSHEVGSSSPETIWGDTIRILSDLEVGIPGNFTLSQGIIKKLLKINNAFLNNPHRNSDDIKKWNHLLNFLQRTNQDLDTLIKTRNDFQFWSYLCQSCPVKFSDFETE